MLKKFLVLLVIATLNLCMSDQSFAIPGFMKQRMGTMSGQVVSDGKPLAKAILAFFDVSKGLPPLGGNAGRIPDMRYLSDDEGRFSLKLLQGSYYLGVLVRGPEEPIGPPRKGEFFYFADGGEGTLRKLLIEDFKQVDYGEINCSLPEVFNETEGDYYLVEGTVYEGEFDEKPFAGAIVLARKNKSFGRPDYVSAETGPDGRFSLKIRPGETFYLVTRTALTGSRPTPGENIGKYSTGQTTTDDEVSMQGTGPPPGVTDDQPTRVVNAEAMAVTGAAGEVLSGIKIHMYKMPDQKVVQEELKNAAGSPKFSEGEEMNILFVTNSYKLAESSLAELDQWARFLKGRPDITIELSGHTDSIGNEAYNQELSTKRANSVAKYLLGKGIDVLRIVAAGYGSTKPVADNSSAAGRSKNRRVEIKFAK